MYNKGYLQKGRRDKGVGTEKGYNKKLLEEFGELKDKLIIAGGLNKQSLGELEAYHAGAVSDYATVSNYFNPRPKDSYDIADAISAASTMSSPSSVTFIALRMASTIFLLSNITTLPSRLTTCLTIRVKNQSRPV